MLKHGLIGLLIGALTAAVMLILSALLLSIGDFDASVAAPLGNICLAVGSGVGSLCAALMHKSKGLVIGITVGLSMFVLVSIISLFVSGAMFTVNTVLKLVIMSLVGAVGGIIGVNLSAKRKLV